MMCNFFVGENIAHNLVMVIINPVYSLFSLNFISSTISSGIQCFSICLFSFKLFHMDFVLLLLFLHAFPSGASLTQYCLYAYTSNSCPSMLMSQYCFPLSFPFIYSFWWFYFLSLKHIHMYMTYTYY